MADISQRAMLLLPAKTANANREARSMLLAMVSDVVVDNFGALYNTLASYRRTRYYTTDNDRMK